MTESTSRQDGANFTFWLAMMGSLLLSYWPCLFDQDGWILAAFFFVLLLTWTSSPSIKMQKKNLANIQPSWPQTWSIMHIYWLLSPCCGSTHIVACGSSYFIIKRIRHQNFVKDDCCIDMQNFAWVSAKSRTLYWQNYP